MSLLDKISSFALVAGFIAVVVGLFLKGSRTPQPLEVKADVTRRPVWNMVTAILSPGVSVVVFYLGVRSGFTNNRIFDALITLPLVFGAFCGRRAFRSTGTTSVVRILGLVAVIVCAPSSIVFLFITIFGVG
jgi:hypothetical protein